MWKGAHDAMSYKRLIVGFTGVGLSAVLLAAAQPPKAPVLSASSDEPAFEYRRVTARAEMTQLGSDGGWELVSVDPDAMVFRHVK
jgi:hypothetical protein